MSSKESVEKVIKKLKEDPNNSRKYLETRGRGCISQGMIKKAKDAAKSAKDDRDFLKRLAGKVRYLMLEGDKVCMVYPRCFCRHAKKYSGKLPKVYCECSVGWVKEMFEQALDRKVEVKLESSVLRGDKECRLQIVI